jgi:hypothetical protein
MPQPTPRGAYRGNPERRSGACGATATMPGCGWPSAARPGPRATTAAETRGRSAGREAAAGLERCERAHPLSGRQPVFERLHGEGSCSHDRQQGQRHRARVICRYHPVQLRTSYCSSPTSLVAASTPLSMVQRVPATRTTSANVVSGRAKRGLSRRLQLLPEAGAQRTPEAVSCKPWLDGGGAGCLGLLL